MSPWRGAGPELAIAAAAAAAGAAAAYAVAGLRAFAVAAVVTAAVALVTARALPPGAAPEEARTFRRKPAARPLVGYEPRRFLITTAASSAGFPAAARRRDQPHAAEDPGGPAGGDGRGQVSADGQIRALPAPFIVLATDNPIEYEGTYELPEAQLDRFIMRLRLGYLTSADETAMLQRRLDRAADRVELSPVTTAAGVLAMRGSLERVEIDPDLLGYIVQIVNATRGNPQIQVGASPRGGLALVQLARGEAVLRGRDFVIPDDVKQVAVPALAHRVTLRPELWVRRVAADEVVQAVLSAVPTPRADPARAVPADARRGRFPANARRGADGRQLPGGAAGTVTVTWQLSRHARRLLTLALAGLLAAVITGRPQFAGLAAPALLLLAGAGTARPGSVAVQAELSAAAVLEGEQVAAGVTAAGTGSTRCSGCSARIRSSRRAARSPRAASRQPS
ncbi:MAG TPA: MoxR family ATPase [Streptosporangiaceae bacterium]|nr:MoxR family ATPase [Streptosporangiaceae bacterium]